MKSPDSVNYRDFFFEFANYRINLLAYLLIR